MIRQPPRSTRTDTLFPYTTLFRSQPRGLLAALTDTRLAKALSAVHERPGEEWTIQSMAQTAGMSRTAFAELFTQTVGQPPIQRSEEHTSELQSLMRISYAVFCLKKKTTT